MLEKVMALIAISVSKKITVYAIGRYYGYPRLYRRFVEFNERRFPTRKDKIRRRKNVIKYVFRFPNKLSEFYQKFVKFRNKLF